VTFVKIVPMAFVMIAGPQIISSVMFATSERARATSLASVSGAVTSVVAGTALCFFLFEALGLQESGAGGSHEDLDWLFAVLLAILAIRVFLERAESEPPAWMGKLQAATPGFALKLGLLLFIAMPTDILTMLTVGGYLSAHGESLWSALPFWALTALFVGTPLLVLLALGRRAETTLPKVRDWMNANSWIVSEIVIVFFFAMELKDALSA
jgi:Sap-like sulfolipid-1-addressing protein